MLYIHYFMLTLFTLRSLPKELCPCAQSVDLCLFVSCFPCVLHRDRKIYLYCVLLFANVAWSTGTHNITLTVHVHPPPPTILQLRPKIASLFQETPFKLVEKIALEVWYRSKFAMVKVKVKLRFSAPSAGIAEIELT